MTSGKVYKKTNLLKYFAEGAKLEVRGEKSMKTHSLFLFTPTSFLAMKRRRLQLCNSWSTPGALESFFYFLNQSAGLDER